MQDGRQLVSEVAHHKRVAQSNPIFQFSGWVTLFLWFQIISFWYKPLLKIR